MFHVEHNILFADNCKQIKKMKHQEVLAHIRDVKDFPVPGIIFKDITTVLSNPEYLKWMKDEIVNLYRAYGITKVVGIESRGFILGPAVAMDLGAGFVPVRKPGKLPAETIEVSYSKEYGVDTIQIHADALNENDVVLLHDDLLATGGSMAAALELVRKFGVKKVYINFIIELDFLNGRKTIGDDVEISSLLNC